MRNAYDLIVFDWDGTLFDSTALITRCIRSACADLGIAVPSERDASFVIGLGLAEALQHAAPSLPPERYPELGERFRFHYLAGESEIVLFGGILPLLDTLKARGHRLAVATGKSRRGLDHALASVQLRGVFDATRTADETASKPHPRMLLELMAELGVAPGRTLMIGDTTHDLAMASAAGADSIGVSYGAHGPDGLSALAPRHVAHSVVDLGGWLQRHG